MSERIGFYELPSTPKDRQRLLDAIENCRQALVRVKSEQDYIKDTVKEFAKEFDIKGADLNRLINDRAKGTFGQSVQKADIYQDLYEALYANSIAEARGEIPDSEDEEPVKAEPARNADFLADQDDKLNAFFDQGTVAETA